jgi:hypothetical protein
MEPREPDEVILAPKRDARGHFLPGYTANPGGRPKTPALLRDASPEAQETLIKIMRGEIVDERISVGQAAIAIIERTVPKPVPERGTGGAARLRAFADLLLQAADDEDEDDEEDSA